MKVYPGAFISGFTLVELMISVLILGVGLTAVTNSYTLALRGANAAGNNIGALILAKEKFAALEMANLKGALPASAVSETISSSGRDYNYQQEINLLDEADPLEPYLVSACLAVSWAEKNSSKNVTLASYLLKQK